MATLKFGVFNVDDAWKLYREDGCAQDFIERLDAVSAALRAAELALGAGSEVELYLQDINGEVRRVDPRVIVRPYSLH